MKLHEVLDNIPVSQWGPDRETEITGVTCDSRQVRPGSLFVAVVGQSSDGHRFIPNALRAGAACVLCQTLPETGAERCVVTADTRRALSLACINFFQKPAEKMTMIGVTGTNGKTTSTTLIQTVLMALRGEPAGLVGTNGNRIGLKELPAERTTPGADELQALLAQMAGEGCTACVMEVSSHALCLDRVAGITYDCGAFTNLTQDHLDFHGTMEEYAKAKALLFRQCRRGVVNLDDPWAPVMLSGASCPILTVGVVQPEADLRAEQVRLDAGGVSFTACYRGERVPVRLGIPGMFSVYNALTALGCCLAVGVSLSRAAEALGSCSGVKGRAELVPTGRDFTVLIDYAHTPDALEKILTTIRGFCRGRLRVVFGCGGDRDRTKRPKMGAAAGRLSDVVYVTSDNPRTEEPEEIIREILPGLEGTPAEKHVICDRREAIGRALRDAGPGDVVLLAGKGQETYQILGTEKHHFDEREVVAECLAGML